MYPLSHFLTRSFKLKSGFRNLSDDKVRKSLVEDGTLLEEL